MECRALETKGGMTMAEKETPDLLPALMGARALREPAFAKLVIELAATLAEPNTDLAKRYREILNRALKAQPESAHLRKRGPSPKSPALETQLAAEREVFSKRMSKTDADGLSGEMHNLSPSRVRALAARGRKRGVR